MHNDITKHPQHIAFVFGDEMKSIDSQLLIQKIGEIVYWSIEHQIYSMSFYDPAGKNTSLKNVTLYKEN
jgi:hypothetical protein